LHLFLELSYSLQILKVDNKNSFENVNGFTPTNGTGGSRDENSFKTGS